MNPFSLLSCPPNEVFFFSVQRDRLIYIEREHKRGMERDGDKEKRRGGRKRETDSPTELFRERER